MHIFRGCRFLETSDLLRRASALMAAWAEPRTQRPGCRRSGARDSAPEARGQTPETRDQRPDPRDERPEAPEALGLEANGVEAN